MSMSMSINAVPCYQPGRPISARAQPRRQPELGNVAKIHD
jgi:hypothetical protein